MNRGTIVLSLAVVLGALATGGDQSGVLDWRLLGWSAVLILVGGLRCWRPLGRWL